MAKMLDRELNITIYEPKDFNKEGASGCNHCGGVISEILLQTLAIEGINLPSDVVQKGIHSYRLHTNHGSVSISTPTVERTIATIKRGGGPKGLIDTGKQSFDNFLLNYAVEEGASHNRLKIDKLHFDNGKPVLFSKSEKVQEPDLVVGAVGINGNAPKVFEEMKFGYKTPQLVTAAISEIIMDEEVIEEFFGNSIHLFLLPIKNIKFAAIIPKGNYLTLCILGKEMTPETFSGFLKHPVVNNVLPKGVKYETSCRCFPKMNIKAPEKPFADRVVICGDSGSTRLFKDGIGAAYLMGKAAAKTVVFEGIGESDFKEHYLPTYQSIIDDNSYGRFLYFVTDIFRSSSILSKGMMGVIIKEQNTTDYSKRLSSILWDMFTGNERYKNIFPRALSPKMSIDLCIESGKNIFKGEL